MKDFLSIYLLTAVAGRVYFDTPCNDKMNQCPTLTGVDETYCYERNDKYTSARCDGNIVKISFKNATPDKVAVQWYSESGIVKTFYQLDSGQTKSYKVCPGQNWAFLNLETGDRYQINGSSLWTVLGSYNGRTFDIKTLPQRRQPNIQYFCVDSSEITKGLRFYREAQEDPNVRAARLQKEEEERKKIEALRKAEEEARKAMEKAKAEEEARLKAELERIEREREIEEARIAAEQALAEAERERIRREQELMEKQEEENYESSMEQDASCHVMDFQYNCPGNKGSDDCTFVSFEKIENGETTGFSAEGCGRLGFKKVAKIGGCINSVEEQYKNYEMKNTKSHEVSAGSIACQFRIMKDGQFYGPFYKTLKTGGESFVTCSKLPICASEALKQYTQALLTLLLTFLFVAY